MKTQSVLLLLLFCSALAEANPAASVNCTRSAYEVEKYAQTIGRSSRAIKLSTIGSCRIVKSKRGLSLEAIPGMSAPARCHFMIFGSSPLGKGWTIQAFAIETTSNALHRLATNEFELRADDPEDVEQALITKVTFRGPNCNKWHEAFEPAEAAGDSTP